MSFNGEGSCSRAETFFVGTSLFSIYSACAGPNGFDDVVIHGSTDAGDDDSNADSFQTLYN